MAEWYLHPIIIKNWDEKIDYVMFIDENGNANDIKILNLKKKIIFKSMEMKNILQ